MESRCGYDGNLTATCAEIGIGKVRLNFALISYVHLILILLVKAIIHLFSTSYGLSRRIE